MQKYISGADNNFNDRQNHENGNVCIFNEKQISFFSLRVCFVHIIFTLAENFIDCRFFFFFLFDS